MKSFLKDKKTLFELLRYLVVGAIAALVDLGVLALFTEIIFKSDKGPLALTISTAAGFICGLVANYLLSMLFVFVNAEQKEKNKQKAKTFIIFALVGIIGLILTEVLMHLGMLVFPDEGYWYLLLSCFVKGVVMLWNYFGRKIFVYKGV